MIERIEALREQRGITVADFARSVGITRNAYLGARRERRRLRMTTIMGAAVALRVNPLELFGDEPFNELELVQHIIARLNAAQRRTLIAFGAALLTEGTS